MIVGLSLFLMVWFDGVPIRCLADTGAAITVLNRSSAATVGTMSAAGERLDIVREGGRRIAGRKHSVPNVGTGYLGWERATVLVIADEDAQFPCILGVDLLAQQDITIQWGRNQIYPVAEGPELVRRVG